MQPLRSKVEWSSKIEHNSWSWSMLSIIFAAMYSLIRSLLFNFPPEDVHYFSMNALRTAGNMGILRNWIGDRFNYSHKDLERTVFGLHFKNPVGLGAGFDKNAVYLTELEMLGFGHVEIGTVTPRPQPGNEQPRLFRLPADKALINRMGFNNNGVKAIRGRLENWREKNSDTTMLIGGNLGKNKDTANEDAWKDYDTCFRELHNSVDHFIVNVSSPNTPGLRALQDKDALLKILSHLQELNQSNTVQRPLLLKIAPDLEQSQLDDIIALAHEVKLSGIVATNTTIGRNGLHTSKQKVDEIGNGGLSGKPVFDRSTEVLSYLYEQTNGSLPLIGSGGIFTGADAEKKLNAGASLVQVWTGFIYEGPSIVKNICQHLSKTSFK